MAREFLVSVADAILRDPTTLEAIAIGTANIDSAFTVAMEEAQVRGGINNQLLYVYKHTRKVDVKITDATFNTTIMALNVGSNVVNSSVSLVETDCKTLSSGSAYLDYLPTGDVSVFLPNGTIQSVTPSGSLIYVSGGANQKVDAVYTRMGIADQITVGATTPPDVVDLTLMAEVRNDAGEIVNYLQINVPRFQVSGNYTLSLTANGVSNQSLEGSALAVRDSGCTTGDYYAKATWIPVSSSDIPLAQISTQPDPITFTAGVAGTQQLSVLGIRGGIYSNVTVTSLCAFSKRVGGSAAVSVGASTGLITSASTSTAGSTIIDVLYYTVTSGSLRDTVNVFEV